MADTTWQSSPELIEELLSRGHEFSFEQVMRLARVALGPDRVPELPEDGGQHRLAVRPDLSLAFPAADVARVERTGEDDGGLLVTATFLGLYGSSSPLPTHYTEDLFDEAAFDSSVSRDFLDIIHQRLYQLYCQCWSKYRLFIRVAEEKNPRDRERLLCLIGLGDQERSDSVPDPWSLVRYAGLLTQLPRSAEGLQILLRDALGIRNLDVEQCVLRQAPIPPDQRSRLGSSGVNLGIDAVVGSEMADRMGKFRIHIGPMSKADFDQLLPGTLRHKKLVTLVRLYITAPLDFDLRITLSTGEIRPLILGDLSRPGLGLNTWCFSGDTLGEQTVTFQATSLLEAAPGFGSGSAGTDHSADYPDWAEKREPTSLIEHYQEELAGLRDLATNYAESHPEVASLVGGSPADASVERLFEGVAFLNAHLRQKLDDDWPEIIHEVVAALEPNDLRPIPAATIITFSPKPNCRQPHLIPCGTEVKSLPINGTACRFTTRWPVEIHPLVLTDASFSHPAGKPPTITLRMKLTGLRLDEWRLKSLRLFLPGEYGKASNLYLMLMHYLKDIVIAPMEEGQSVTLDPTHLKPAGFADSEQLFPSGAVSRKIMHEFLILPEKYLSVDLQGWEGWWDRGEGSRFEVRFQLKKLPFPMHHVSKEDFCLFATPAINVFTHTAEPITIEQPNSGYAVRPAGGKSGSLQIHSIENVTGIARNRNLRVPFATSQAAHPDSSTEPTYHATRGSSAHDDTYLSISSPAVPLGELSTLSVELRCTNGKVAERLNIGDICNVTDSSPIFADFSNCTPATRSEYQAVGNNSAWRSFSNGRMSLSLVDARSLRALLQPVSESSCHGHSGWRGKDRRIEGITDVRVSAADSLIGGSMLRGWEVRIKLNRECFVSPGDLYLFGAVLNTYLNGVASQSSFTTMLIDDHDGQCYQWPANRGRRSLG